MVFTAALMISGGLVLVPAMTATAQTTRSPHPSAHTRPPHRPRKVPTPVPVCGGVPVSCPLPAPCLAQAKVWKLFYGYPGRSRTLRALGDFTLDPRSNGIDPVREGGSLTLTDDSGAIILQMPGLQFGSRGSTFTATNDQGSLSIWPFAGQYSFELRFDNPNLPPGFFRLRYNMCLNVGDDGFQQSIVCQKKPGGGFVCHE